MSGTDSRRSRWAPVTHEHRDHNGVEAIVGELGPRWVVPMHYRTPRIGFLESEAEFVGLIDRVERFEASSFDTAGLPVGGGPLAVVPAAPWPTAV